MPTPQPSAVTRSASSLFSSTFAVDTPSVFSTLPRSGRIAWRARSRPCFADPPAESPSTTNSSLVIDPGLVQSASLPGRLTRPAVGPLRTTSACAARLASRARADRMMRATIASAIDWLLIQPVLERPAAPGRRPPTSPRGCSGDPWSAPGTAAPGGTPTACRSCPSRMSSAVSVTPFGDRLCVSM